MSVKDSNLHLYFFPLCSESISESTYPFETGKKEGSVLTGDSVMIFGSCLSTADKGLSICDVGVLQTGHSKCVSCLGREDWALECEDGGGIDPACTLPTGN